jgi:4-hydroxybenzoate polyprenyltransferase
VFKSIVKLLHISRPISWLNTAYPFAAGYLVTGGQFNAFFVVATLFFFIPYNLLMYGINDVFDYESDMKNPRKGGMEGALEQKSFHPVILCSSTLSALPFVAWLLMQGDSISKLILVAVVFFVVAYSVRGLRFKEIPVLDSITSSIHFVGPLVYALSITGFTAQQLPYIIAFFLWGAASHAFGAVQDIVPDRQAGIGSVATVFGSAATVRIVFVLYILAAIIVFCQGWVAWPVGFAGLLYACNVAPYLSLSDKKSQLANTAWRRFIWLNLAAGFVITLVLILHSFYG